ncbi:hypothetical protein [Pseudoramibacter faecis]|uniref:hypothetical protein n=1 Tax=Pseudoramibacter faecis TaxID=3108534 RepID=UPI002E75E769|nr:hypothetical protein [Pseudoramibacter sp. HA2172]
MQNLLLGNRIETPADDHQMLCAFMSAACRLPKGQYVCKISGKSGAACHCFRTLFVIGNLDAGVSRAQTELRDNHTIFSYPEAVLPSVFAKR